MNDATVALQTRRFGWLKQLCFDRISPKLFTLWEVVRLWHNTKAARFRLKHRAFLASVVLTSAHAEQLNFFFLPSPEPKIWYLLLSDVMANSSKRVLFDFHGWESNSNYLALACISHHAFLLKRGLFFRHPHRPLPGPPCRTRAVKIVLSKLPA